MNTPEQPANDTENREEEKDQARVDYEDGQRFLAEGNYAHSANAFHNALIGFEQKGDEFGKANANDKLGDICFAKEEFDKAILYFREAHDICKKHEDLFSILSLQKKMALCHRELRQYEKAVAIYLDMLETHEQIQNPRSAVVILEILAETYYEMGELEKAADAYKTIASIHGNFNHAVEERQFLEKVEELEREMEECS